MYTNLMASVQVLESEQTPELDLNPHGRSPGIREWPYTPAAWPHQYVLQIKGRWKSNINVWFRFMYSQKWNYAASLFPKENYNVRSPNFHIHVYIPRIRLPVLL